MRAVSRLAASLCLLLHFVHGQSVAGEFTFGPATYSLQTGAPQNFKERFSATTSPTCDGGRSIYNLVLLNGDGGAKNSVTSGRLAMNGVEILGDNRFKQGLGTVEVPFSSLPDDNVLDLELKGGKPGSFVMLSVRQELEAFILSPVTQTLTGGLETFEQSFALPDNTGTFVLTLQAGDTSGRGRPTHAAVRLNGVSIFSDLEIAGSPTGILRRQVVLEPINSVVLDVRGEAGDVLTLSVGRLVGGNACGPVVTFTAPAENELVTESNLLVTGTVAGSPDTGVRVNQTIADLDLNHAGTADDPFRWAAIVPATPGPFELHAVATDANGARGEARRNIVYAPQQTALSLRPSVRSGLAPLAVIFEIETFDELERVEADLDGDGVYEIDGPAGTELRHTFEAPGTYISRLRVRSSEGEVLQASAAVVVQTFAVQNQLLRRQWQRFTDALAASDIERALGQLTGSARRKYEPGLRLITPTLPSFAEGLRRLHPVWIGPDAAHYILTRDEDGVERGYYVYFVRDPDGVWKVVQF
jgi:hypothetical protein